MITAQVIQDPIRDRIIEAMEEGWVEPYYLVISLLKYMSTDDLKDCMRINEISLPPLDKYESDEDDYVGGVEYFG